MAIRDRPAGKAAGSVHRESPPTRRSSGRPVFVRAVVLLGLLVALDLWTSRHLGIGLSRRPAWLGVLTTSWVAAASLLDRTLEDEEKKSLARRVRDALRGLLATPVLVAMAALLAVVSSSYSSVAVLGEPEARTARLRPVAGESPDAGWIVGDPPRFLVASGPFGRPYRLSVPGFLPAVLSVPAFRGLQIVPERDLRRPPTLLLRPLPAALGSLEGGGSLEVWTGDDKILDDSCGCRTSYLLGRSQPIPSGALAEWRLELLALHAAPEDSDLFARTLLDWRKPRLVAPSLAALPGTAFTVFVRSRAGKIITRTAFTLSDDPFQDILLE